MLGASSVSAALVTDWGYEMKSEFTRGIWTSADEGVRQLLTNDGTVNEEDLTGPPTGSVWGVQWGCGDPTDENSCTDPFDQENQSGNYKLNSSALTIGSGTDGTLRNGGAASGDIILNGDSGEGSNITHWNNTIWSGFRDFGRGTMGITLSLSPDGSSETFEFDLGFDFDFVETANDGINGVCYGGEAGGACPDLFQIAQDDAMQLINNAFEYDGNTYYASILITDGQGGASPVGALAKDECGLRTNGPQAGCRGWKTTEEAVTTVQWAVKITSTPVPSPAPVALLAVGFVAMGFARRART
jgi:hypothetical protein